MKKLVMLVLVTMLVCSFSACTDRQELSELAIVLGMGFDHMEDDSLQLSVELADRKMPQETGESKVFHVTAKDFTTAMDELILLLDKQLFWGNMMVLVFGDSFTQEQVDDVALALYKSNIFSDELPLLCAEGTAADIINGSFGESEYVSKGLSEAISHDEAQFEPILLAHYVERLLANQASCQQIVRVDVEKIVSLGEMNIHEKQAY